jgi:regulator of replication initiation timing
MDVIEIRNSFNQLIKQNEFLKEEMEHLKMENQDLRIENDDLKKKIQNGK